MRSHDRKFIDIALEFGYLGATQAASVYTLYQYYNRHGHDIPIAQILLQKNYLSQQQVNEVLQRLPQAAVATSRPAAVQRASTVDAEEGTTRDANAEAPADAKVNEECPPTLKEPMSFPASDSSQGFDSNKIRAGSVWRDFEIIEKIGTGGMAEVYKARQKAPQRIVALKMLTAKDISEASLARFLKEAQLSARLLHPHIVKMYLAEIYNQTPFIAMAYIEGRPLDQYCRENRPEIYEILTILGTIAKALHYAHEENIIHRDIKPANIMIANDGTAYLMDFGIARATVADFSLTRSGQLLGTPQYMAPEQADGENKTLDRRADIYSLGVLMYELLTGHAAVEGNTVVEILYNLTTQTVIPPRHWKPDLPEALEFIILKAMAPEREQRYSTAQEFAQGIAQFLADKNLKPKRNLEYFRLKFGYYYQLHRHKAVALVAAVLLVLGCWWFWPEPPDPEDLTRQAAACFLKQKYDQALELLEKSLALQQEQPQALLLKSQIAGALRQLALADFVAQKLEPALGLLDKSLALKPDQQQALILKAKICARLQRRSSMLLAWDQLFSFFGRDLESLEFLAKQALHYQDWERAVCYFTAWSQQQPQKCPKAQLAIVLIKSGEYARAAEYLNQTGKKDDTIRLATAMLLYHQGDFDHSQKILPEIVAKKLNSTLMAELYFLKAKLRWQHSQKQLTRWQWLLPNIYNSQQDSEIDKSLEAIAADLGKAARANPDYPEIAHYFTALQIERIPCNPGAASPQKQFVALSANLSPEFRNSLLFQKITVHYLIRHKQWRQAAQLCSQLADRYPWEADFYYFRAIAHLACGDEEKILDDIKNAAAIDQYNFIPVETFLLLTLRHFTQREYYLFYRLVDIYFLNPAYPIDHLLFTARLQKLRNQFFHGKKLVVSIDNNGQSPVELIEKALQTHSQQARELMTAIIAADEDEDKLEQNFDSLQKRYRNDSTRNNHLKQIRKQVKQHKRLQIQQTLLRYAVALDDRYTLKLKRNSRASQYLQEIFTDASQAPMMRFLAAKMLMALRDFPAFSELLKIAQSDKYPGNLLATVAIRQAGIVVPMPELKNFREKKVFYRALYAWHLFPHSKQQQRLARKLLDDPQEIVALYAAYNLRRYHDLPAKLQKRILRTFRARLFQSADAQIRAAACRAFWSYSHMGRSQFSPLIDKRKQIKACVAAFNIHYRQLLAFFRDRSPEVRLAAIISSIGESMFKRNGIVRRIKPEVAQAIEKELQALNKQGNSYAMRFWTMAALGIWNRGGNFLDVVGNSSLPFSVRIGAIFGVYHRRTIAAIGGLFQFIEKPSQTVDDRALKKALIVMIAHLTKRTFNNLSSYILNQILKWQQHRDIEIRRAAIASLLWCGNYRHLELLQTHLQPPKGDDMQCAAMASYCALLARYRPPRQVEAFNRRIMSYPLALRTAAAFGYYHAILHENYVSKTYSARKWYEQYCQAIKKNCRREWLPLLDYATQLTPEWRYFYEAALIHYQLRQFEPAEQQLHKALLCLDEKTAKIDNWPKAICLILSAQMLNDRGQYQDAIAKLSQAAEAMPFSAKIHFRWAENLYAIGQKDQAIAKFAQSYLCNPENARPLYHTAAIYLKQKNVEAAITVLKFSYAKFPIRRCELLAKRGLAALKDHPWIKSLRN